MRHYPQRSHDHKAPTCCTAPTLLHQPVGIKHPQRARLVDFPKGQHDILPYPFFLGISAGSSHLLPQHFTLAAGRRANFAMNHKRPHQDDDHHHHHQRDHKRQKDHHGKRKGEKNTPLKPQNGSQKSGYQDAINQLPHKTNTSVFVPPNNKFTIAPGLPPLPAIPDPELEASVFRHKSTIGSYNRSNESALSYEKLEFLGDAYLETIASRLLYERFNALPSGYQSQLRELLVKNTTLSDLSRGCGFEKRLKLNAADYKAMLEAGEVHDRQAVKGNKGYDKILADVFEAYVAAVIISNGDEGFAIAETWLTGLWAPKLLEAMANDKALVPSTYARLHHDPQADPLAVYNPQAKAELQKKVLCSGLGVKLDYEPYAASVELKGDQLGQNRHFIAVYLSGYGYQKKLLGKGEGRNKVEAGNWAAMRALHEHKELLDECEKQYHEYREKRRKEKEAEAEAAGTAEVPGSGDKDPKDEKKEEKEKKKEKKGEKE
jgi:ribonuclease III